MKTPARGNGFTAIELVTALTIMMGLTAMLGIILARANHIWHVATEDARTRQTARRVLDLLTRDLEQSVTDARFPFVIGESATNAAYGGYVSADIRFMTLGTIGYDGASEQRLASAVGYWVESAGDERTDGLVLMRGFQHQTNVHDTVAEDNFYGHTNRLTELDFQAPEPVAAHIAAFRVFTPEPDGLIELGAIYDSRLYSNRPPPFADVFLELLTPADARRLARLPDDRQAEFVDRRAIRYTTRVALGNRWGRAYRGR